MLCATLPCSVKKNASSCFRRLLILGIGWLLSYSGIFRGEFGAFAAPHAPFNRSGVLAFSFSQRRDTPPLRGLFLKNRVGFTADLKGYPAGTAAFTVFVVMGRCKSVEVVEAEGISLVPQRFLRFPWWNRRGNKSGSAPTLGPHFSHSAGEEKCKRHNDFLNSTHAAHCFQYTSSTIACALLLRSQIIRGEVSPRSSFLVFLLPSLSEKPSSANALVNDRTGKVKLSP